MEVKNYLLGYKDMYIYQDTDMFNFSLDSVLLPNFITINKNAKEILDIGCGNAPIPLILSTKTVAKITGVEIQPEVAALARKSITENKLTKQIEIINQDINEFIKDIDHEKYDIITCNPPFFKVGEDSNLNDNDYKTIARHEVKLNLDQILSISRRALKNGGILGIVHRPERLIDILECMRQSNIEPKRIQFVYPKEGKEANILLIEGMKNGKTGIKVLPPLFVHEENGQYSKEVLKFFE